MLSRLPTHPGHQHFQTPKVALTCAQEAPEEHCPSVQGKFILQPEKLLMPQSNVSLRLCKASATPPSTGPAFLKTQLQTPLPPGRPLDYSQLKGAPVLLGYMALDLASPNTCPLPPGFSPTLLSLPPTRQFPGAL